MFGSTNPFGQSSSSPFGSQSGFGQTNNASANPFAPKPFGSPNAFGSQTGSSIFGGTSTGVFGQPSTPAFGASSSPAFGASSTPAFGSSLFGQKPAFGSFGSSPSQSSPFGNTVQQTQPAFGSNLFGSTSPFGASSQPAFGASSTSAFGSTPSFGTVTTPSFGATNSPAFGATSTPAFGSTTTPAFGSTSSTPAFGSTTTPVFGSTGTAFGVSSTPAFGSSMTPSFGAPSASVFGSSSTPAFGASTTPTFGSPTVAAFGVSSTPSFSFSSAPSFGQSSPAFGSTQFGTASSPFGAQSSAFGAQATTPAFGSPGFGQTSFGVQAGGTRTASYTPTPEADGGTGTQPAGKMESISAMPVYKDKSHEELRWEDYQRGDKGGPNPSAQPTGGIGLNTASQPTGGISFNTAPQPSPFGSTGTFGQSAANPFSSVASNPFAPKPQGFGASSSSLFSSTLTPSSSSPFGSTPSTTSLFGSSNVSTFGSSPSPFGTTAPSFTSSSIFGSSLAGSTPSFGALGNTQSSGLFQSSAPSFPQTSSPFGQTSTGFQQTTSAFGSNIFNTQSTGFSGGLFSSSTPFQSSTPSGFGQAAATLQTPFAPQTSNGFAFTNFGQSQPASSSGFGTTNIFTPGNFSQTPATQSSVVMQPTPVTNPFGTLPAMPVMSIARAGSAPSIQYGISTMPVSEKPIQVRTSAFLVPRHFSQRRIKLPPRKFDPKTDGLRVPFYSENDDAPTTPKADAFFIRRENPRTLIIRPIEQWPPRNGNDKPNITKETPVLTEKEGNVIEPSAPAFDETYARDNERNPTENGHARENGATPTEHLVKTNGTHNGGVQSGADSPYAKISGHGTGTGIESLMPKLRHTDYYTEPRIQELAAKERAEPGFCSRVKDFVVGRHGYGSIKFFGETDVRRLDLESIVQLNNREVIVYMDETKKPPVGQGLNKPAEVTLLNIMCVNKKTGKQHTEGPMVEKYKDILLKKTQEQGAEFLSYDAIKGEWKFKVKHFSCYEFVETDEDDSES